MELFAFRSVLSLALSPDGNILVTGGITGTGEGKLDFWNTSNLPNNVSRIGNSILAYKNSQVWDLDFSSNGKTVATGSRDNSVLLWDTTYIGQDVDWFGRRLIEISGCYPKSPKRQELLIMYPEIRGCQILRNRPKVLY